MQKYLPDKEEVLKVIDKLGRSYRCAKYFDIHPATFIRWLKRLGIKHNFHKTLKGYWKGKHLTVETKQKISKSKKGKKRNKILKR